MPPTATLSFELLRTFVALVQHDGYAGQAMRALGLNQPTMSKRLRHLQHAGLLLRRPWLVRKGKRWELTAEGRRILPAVTDLVQGYVNLQAFLGGEEVGRAQVRFACGQQTAQGLVREALRAFRAEHPHASLRISTLRGQARIEGVANGSLDLAIVSHEETAIAEIARRPLHVEPLLTHRLALVDAGQAAWSRSFRRLPADGVSPSAFQEFPLILPEPDAGIRKSLDHLLRREGVFPKLNVVLEVGGWSTILGYVRDGHGVGLVSEGVLAEETGLTVRYLDPDHFLPIATKLICRRLPGMGEQLDLSAEARAWREVLLKVAAKPG
jgi:LysR family transcriptional activator of glutamate synthase operon